MYFNKSLQKTRIGIKNKAIIQFSKFSKIHNSSRIKPHVDKRYNTYIFLTLKITKKIGIKKRFQHF